MTTGRAVAGCTHPRARHTHGTYAAYSRDSCRCDDCTTAGRRYEKRNRVNLERGHTGYIDAEPTRARLQALLDAGLTIGQIEARTGINRAGLYYLRDGRGQRRVTRETAAKIAAVQPTPVDTRDKGMVDATGTRRRIQALNRIGWSQADLAELLGTWPANVTTFRGAAQVTADTRARVIVLYDDLWDRPGGSTRTRLMATRKGWAPPMAWDDDSIDVPDAEPAGATLDVVKRRGDGATVENLEWLLAGGESLATITARLGRHSTLLQACYRADRADLAARLKGAA